MTSEDLLKDGSSKLNKAVEKGDLKGAGVAQMMIFVHRTSGEGV